MPWHNVGSPRRVVICASHFVLTLTPRTNVAGGVLQGAKNTKMQQEVIALKAQIVTMERRQASVVKAAVKVGFEEIQ